MIKYCFILDEELGTVQLGVGCSDEYYIEIGMQQRDVQQSDIDFQWYLKEKCPMKTEEEKFIEAKENKINEATVKAKEAVENGYIQYGNAQIETNAQTVGDLNSTRELCIITGQSSYNWLSKDDVPLTLIIDTVNPLENDDFVKIGLAIADFKNNIWTTKYVQYMNEIKNAQTIEEVEAIEIVY